MESLIQSEIDFGFLPGKVFELLTLLFIRVYLIVHRRSECGDRRFIVESLDESPKLRNYMLLQIV